MKRILFLLMVPFLVPVNTVIAQDGNSQISYSNLALQFSTQNFNGDAATGLFPSVASANGYGSFIDNPASIALIKDNYFNFSMVNNQVEYENNYLNRTLTTEDQSTKLGNIGFVYKIPTEQGSFVLGGGFNRVTFQNGISRFNARNSESTITDAFKDPNSDYYDIAYNAYAIDWGDVDSTYLESIFRIGFEEYPGITQEAKVSYQTDIGEYSFFFGTEFQKNFFIGISGGLTAGNYTYRRDFLELDDQGDYDYNFIPSTETEDGTDIDNILTHDEIDAEIIGFSLRSGLIYKFSPNFNIGLSYLLPSTIIVRENYYSSIKTELDDGSVPYESDFASGEAFEYRIKKPGQLNLGLAAIGIGNFEITLSGELIDYSNLRMDFITGANVDFDEEVVLREQQQELDDFMINNYNTVINGKAGLAYNFTGQFKIKAGYAYLPGKSKNYEVPRNIISGGFSAHITENILVDVNGQYSFWDDRSVIYKYYDESNVNRAEVVDQQASSLKILAGIRFLF
ncbi:MAG: hypothetical protein WD022_05850 [Balneolaceae bacterium]